MINNHTQRFPLVLLCLAILSITPVHSANPVQAARSAASPDTGDLELVGRTTGEPKKIVVKGNYAYNLSAHGLPTTQLEMMAPSGPGVEMSLELVGQIDGDATAVAVQGDYAYVGLGSHLVALKISDPTVSVQSGNPEP